MNIEYETLKNWPFAPIEQTYTERDTILYALGLNFGTEPTSRGHLQYVYERGLRAFPTFAVVLGFPGPWMANPRTGIDVVKVLHAEQRLTIHRPLPPAGTVVAKTRVLEVIDKGAERGAILITERTLHEKAGGELLCTQMSSTFCRGNGGFGGSVTASPSPHAMPSSAPQRSADTRTSRRAALIYRLSGDYNPLHCDPQTAAAAGFREPILHGLCSYGIAARSIIEIFCDGDGDLLRALDVRFSSPVYPGETLRTEMWSDGSVIAFRTRVLERDVVVLNHGRAQVGPLAEVRE